MKENRIASIADRQGGYSRLVPLNTECPNAGNLVRVLAGPRARFLIRIRVCAGPASFPSGFQVGLLMSLSRLSGTSDLLWKEGTLSSS